MHDHDPFHRRRHPRQLLIPLHSWGIERILPLVSHDRPPSQAIVRDHLRLLARRCFCLPRDRSDAADLLFQLLLDMAVRITDGLRHIFQRMLLAHLMRHCGELVAYSSADGCLLITDRAHNRQLETSYFFNQWLNVSRGTGQPCLGYEDASRTHISQKIERFMSCCWLDPINGQDDAIQWSQGLDELFISMDHRCDQRSKDLAQQGHLFERDHALRFRLKLLSNLDHGYVGPVSQFSYTCHHIQSEGISTPGQCIFLWRSIEHCWSCTSCSPACQHLAHHVHVLIESNAPSLLVVALLQGLLTGRTLQLSRREVYLCACTSVPWGAPEVESFFPS